MAKKRQPKRDTRPKIEYPPLTTKKWIPPDQRPKRKRKPTYKKPSKLTVKLDRSSLKKVWHNFDFIDHETLLLVGHYSQFYKKYGFKSCGFQAPANCVVACAFAQMFDMSKWTRYTLDKILDVGDKLYSDSVWLLQKHETFIKLEQVYHTYYVDKFRITMCTKGKHESGKMFKELEDKGHFVKTVPEFLMENNFAIITMKNNRYFAVWFLQNGYYIFDPCEHDLRGLLSTAPIGRGYCVLFKVRSIENLRQLILDWVRPTEINPVFKINSCEVARKFEINTTFPECLEDANLELRAFSDADRIKIEEIQIEKLKAKGALLLQPKPPDPNDRMIEDDDDSVSGEEEEEGEAGDAAPVTPAPDEDVEEEEAPPPPKLVMRHVKPPIEKVHAASLTYFRELIPHFAGILRGSMHQADPKFMRCAGRQSITNAISAVAMLRIFSSKYWTSTVLDEILRNGNQMYRESMKAFPGEPVLKITTLCETIKIEEREFAPKVKPFRVVGKLGSDSEDLLDLLGALKELFLEEDVCIVLGPLILAVWRTKGVYYMFDPNERDAKGLKIIRQLQVGSKIELIQVDPGSACLIWFSNLKDLVDLYMRNVDQDRRREQFILCKIQVDDYVKLPPKYYAYQPLTLTRWMIRGTFSQNNKKFPDTVRNTQSTAIATFAIAMHRLKHVKLWTTEDLDKIVETGTKLYQQTLDHLHAKNKYVSRLLMTDELITSFSYEKMEIRFQIQSCFTNGCIFNDDSDHILNLKQGLKEFFEEGCCGVITCRGLAIAVFYVESYYYYFDAHTKNEEGKPSFYGTSVCIRTNTLEELVSIIFANLPADTNDLYNITKVDVEVYEGEGTPQPPLNHFIGLDKNRAILRSRFSEIDDRFGLAVGKQTICMNLYALAMSYVIPTLLWSVDIVNEVMDLGNDHYKYCMDKIIEEEVKEQKGEGEGEEQGPAVKIEEPPKDDKGSDKKRGKKGKEEEAPHAAAAATPPPEPAATVALESETPDTINITSENVITTFDIGINRFDLNFAETQEGTYADLEETLKKIYVPPEKAVENGEEPTKPASILKTPKAAEAKPGGQEAGQEGEEGADDDEDDRKLYLIESKHMTCVMWFEDEVYYVFDPKPRDENGQIYGKYEWPRKKPHHHHRRSSKRRIMNDTDSGGAGDMTSETAATLSDAKNLGDEGNVEAGHEYRPLDLYFGDEEGIEEEEEEEEEELHRHSSHYWHEKEKSGKAYVMRFIYPEDLVKQIVGNTPPLETTLPYKLTPITLVNTVLQKDVFEDENNGTISNIKNVGSWNEFLEIDKGKWILRGTITETCEIFPEINRGRQTTAIALLALSFQKLYTLPIFKTQTVDDIAVYGDRLHTFSLNNVLQIRRSEKDEKIPEEDLLQIVLNDMTNKLNLAKEYCIAGDMIQYSMELNKIIGDIKADAESEDLLDVKRGLDTLFAESKTGLLESKDLLVAVWKHGTAFYMYDSHSRGPSGAKCINGVSCITRFLNLSDMANLFLSNLPFDGDNRFFIHSVSLESMKCPRDEVRKTPVKIQAPKVATAFETISPGKGIVRGSISQQDPNFKRQQDAQSGAMALVALAMTLVHNPMFWTHPILDEIITIGDALYGQALDSLGYNFNPWEQSLTIDLVPADFYIGELKVNCEIRENEQTGVVDALHSGVDNLRRGLEKFFVENTHGVITTEPLTVAIWEEEEPTKTLYMFDPCPRGISGMPADKEDPSMCRGTACVVTFDSYKAAADHFTALIAPDTSVDFTVSPVEICVGKMKTKGRDKKKRKKDELPLAIIGRGWGKELSKPCEKKKIQQLIKDMRKQQDERRMAKQGRRTFYMLPGNEMAILRGSRSQSSPYFCELSRGFQDIPNCLSAYVMERLLPFIHWSEDVINMVLDIGDQLYKDSYVVFRPTNKKLDLDSVIRDIIIKDVRVSIAIGKPVLFNRFTPICVEKALEMFFRQKMYCMMRINCDVIALFCKDDLYFMFDPHDLTLEGKTIPEKGEAVLMKFNQLRKMSEVIVANYNKSNDGEDEEEMIFSLILITIKAMQKMPRRIPKDLCD